ncbi:heat shock protein DnaJ domain protein [Anaeromyxobacter dehalogenans 2CP-1]|uniref:Heat shock protein DnaJ domain protein n=1 Tax=Anaeromyxobacter dehalogenans (strain ATCC BAA-258 / DSM 21875 / 2CP-1) TaxID=455488 RepID=B8J8A3_ANAD2|nr:helix-turn-helix domain-containing protein [Anaeromyxobacter dehalogenans]ACL65402.1 heat shock protein DnaJ domain protein [Anaeromyxobacter dehalogenans 2CP-1]
MLKRLADQTLYEILEVPPDASSRDIAEAVERARALYGPGSIATYTLMSSEEASLLTRRIEEAQSTLLDPDARRRYDDLLGDRSGAANAETSEADAGDRWPARVLPLVPQPDRDEALREAEASAEESWPLRPGHVAGASAPTPPPPADGPPPVHPRPPPIPLRREVSGPAMTPVPLPSVAQAGPEPIPLVSPAAPGGAPAPEATAWTGEVLRRLREARGITLQQLSERIKVTRHHIENIEGDRFALLPAPVYLRGILLSMARELRLDGQKVARSYLERVTAATAPGAPRPR